MMSPSDDEGLVCVHIAQGQMQAHVFKAHLESAGIPAVLQYESVGLVYGILADGLGEVRVLVPAPLVDQARHVLENPEPLDEELLTGA